MALWTDYPIEQLGDPPSEEAPVRECELLEYDRDKYAVVRVHGVSQSVKLGYVYTDAGRCGEVPAISHEAACRLLGLTA